MSHGEHEKQHVTEESNKTLLPSYDFAHIISYSIICFVCMVPYMYVFYPGMIEVDTWYMLASFFGYTDKFTGLVWNPVFPVFDSYVYGMLFSFGTWLGDGDQRTGMFFICLLQCIGISVCWSLISCYVEKWGVSKWIRLLLFLFLCLFPVFPMIAIDIGKDTFYLMFFIPFTICFIEVIRIVWFSGNDHIHGKRNILISLMIFSILSSLSTSKGKIIVITCLIILLIALFIRWYSKKKEITVSRYLREIMLSTLSCLILVMVCTFSFQNIVEKPLFNGRTTTLQEMFGTGVQQTTYALKFGDNIAYDDIKRLDKYYDVNEAVTNVVRNITDNTKNTTRSDSTIHEAIGFLHAYVDIGMTENVKWYIKALEDLYHPYYNVFSTDSVILPRFLVTSDTIEKDARYTYGDDIPDDSAEMKRMIRDGSLWYYWKDKDSFSEYKDFGPIEQDPETLDCRNNIFCWLIDFHNVPIFGVLVSKVLYVLFIPILCIIASLLFCGRRRLISLILQLPLILSTMFCFVSPVAFSRYAYPNIALAFLILILIWRIITTTREKKILELPQN